jgi:hypothetical protein
LIHSDHDWVSRDAEAVVELAKNIETISSSKVVQFNEELN